MRSRLKQWEEAEAAYQKVLSLNAKNPKALDGLLKVRLLTCRWEELEILTNKLWEKATEKPGEVSPFQALYLSFSAEQQQVLAQSYAEALAQKLSESKD